VKEILEKDYTESNYFPALERTQALLEPEIKLKAVAAGEDPGMAVQTLQQNVVSLKSHLKKHREYLMEQPELKAVASSKNPG